MDAIISKKICSKNVEAIQQRKLSFTFINFTANAFNTPNVKGNGSTDLQWDQAIKFLRKETCRKLERLTLKKDNKLEEFYSTSRALVHGPMCNH